MGLEEWDGVGMGWDWRNGMGSGWDAVGVMVLDVRRCDAVRCGRMRCDAVGCDATPCHPGSDNIRRYVLELRWTVRLSTHEVIALAKVSLSN